MLHDAGDAARDTMTQIADKTVSVATGLRIGCAIPSPIGTIAIRICSAQRRSRSQLPSALLTTGELKRIRDYAGIEAAKVRSAKRQTESWKGTTLRLKRFIGSRAANREPCAMGGVGFSETPPFKDTFHGQATEAP